MSSEPLPGEFLKDTTSYSSEPVEIGNNRWRHSPATPSSCRWSGDGGCGPFDFRRPVTGHGIQRDQKGETCRETSGLISSNMHLQSDFGTSWDQRSKDNDDGVGATNRRLEKDVSLGSSLDWKPIKWIRSGSLSSRGSGFSLLSSCKVVGVDSSDSKMDAQQGNVNITLLRSPSGDAATCVTPKTPDEANSRKKPRLGWGEGLAKYEKKKVDPDDKENVSSNGTADGLSSSESLLPSPSSLPCKSPSLTSNSENASPTTPCSFACSLSPGLEEKTSITSTTVVNNTCNPTVVSQNQNQRSPFSLENLDLTEGFNVSLLLDELLQSDDTSAHGSGFAMDKLQVWKADISRTLEITESEIDSLEHELKSDIDSSPFTAASSSLLKQCNNKNTDVSTDASCTVFLGGDVYNHMEDKSYALIYDSNKVTSCRASDELGKLLPTTHLRTGVSRATDEDSDIKKKVAMRKRFLKFKERVTILKFRTFQYSWKENLRLISIRSGAKSQKKFESSSRMGYSDHQKHRASNHYRLSSSGGSLSLVPTKEVVEYANALLSDSRVKTYRNEAKMPTFILDKKERTCARFISDNGLVENPIDVEKERSIVNLWTVEDTETFLDKYSLFGKNFRKIASFFQHKTVADCVEFYYKYHKSDVFQKTKKKSQFAKGKSCNTNSTYLVTSGKRLNRETGATSLDMLGAASAMVANVDGGILEPQSNDFSNYCNEQETAAADVLAGICGSISSEAMDSCVTSSVDHQKVGGSSNRQSLIDVDEETCSDDSCGEEINSSVWTDEERSSFVKAFRSYGKDFSMISRCMRTRSTNQCKLFFSKACKCLGLDAIDFGTSSEGTTGANERGGGGGSDQDDTCMVDSGSGISHDNVESDMNVVNDCSRESELLSENPVARDCEAKRKVDENGSRGNLEGAADSDAADIAEAESPQNTCSDSASGAKVEEFDTVTKVSSHGNGLDLNTATENFTCLETTNNGFMTSNLFPQEPSRKTLTRDDVSSRLTFRKSSQRSSSIDGYGYQLHLHKRSHSHDDPQGLDENLLLPRDGCLQMGTDSTSDAQQQRRSSSLDVEKPNTSGGDLKLFGKIITNHSLPKVNGSDAHESETKLDAVTSSNLKTSYGFWDGNRIQTGFSTLPDSAMFLAKYPAAFSNISSLETGNEQCNNLTVLPGYPTRKLTNNRGPSYHAYGQSITVDKLLPEMRNGVSDPVAAIRMHFAKTEQYKTGGCESWSSNVSDIGSR
ncbi:putative transcription factor MYB/SANT family [Helianthus anomalus]